MTTNANDKTIDPIRQWRDWFVTSEKQWSDALTQMMGSEQVARGVGRTLLEALHAHRIWCEGAAQYLASLNLPSRTDVVDVHDRLARVEKALDDLRVELREQCRGGARPQRGRKPDRESDS